MASSSDSPPISGSCLCKAVRYTVTGKPIYTVICHCENCRRITGSAFITTSLYPKEAFDLTSGDSALKSYTDGETDTGTPLERKFCGTCGSTVLVKTGLNDNIVAVAAGTMDNFRDWIPQKEQYCGDRAGWLKEVEGWGSGWVKSDRGPVIEDVVRF